MIRNSVDVLSASKEITFHAGKVAGAAEAGDVATVRDEIFRLAILVGELARYAVRQERQS